MANSNKNYITDIIDEIALEGLDGITLEALWQRLIDRPGFIIKPIDDDVKVFLWNRIIRLPNVSFYSLPNERKAFLRFKRKEFIDSHGHFYEPEDLPLSIYPHSPVEDNGIMGSCYTYKTRKDISEVVRRENYETAKRLGNTLVIVADQETRSKSISYPEFNPVTELGVMQYCLLERIGRSRYDGETTQGRLGLQVVTDDPKMLYYFRKLLSKNKLIQKQIFYMKVGRQTSTGSLIHLPRFYSEIKSKQDSDAHRLINFLQGEPKKWCTLKRIHNVLNIELKKLLLKYPKNFKTFQVPYRTMYPDSKPNEWKLKSCSDEKSVRVLKLLSPTLAKDDDEEEDDEEEIGLIDESRRRMDRSLIRQAYSLVEEAGPRGIKQGALGCLLALPSLQARSICKHLVKKQLVKTVLMDQGRQRISYFYCSKFDSAKTSLTNEVIEERNKLLHAISINTELRDESVAKESIDCEENCENNEELNDTNQLNRSDPIGESGSQQTPFKDVEKSCEGNNVNVDTEIVKDKTDSSPEKNPVSLIEDMKNLENSEAASLMTARLLKRASLIVQAVNLHKVIQDTQKIQRIISDFEEAEGLKLTVDRKSIQRLLEKLESDGLLRTIKVNLKGYGKEKCMMFICHPSVNESMLNASTSSISYAKPLVVISEMEQPFELKELKGALKSLKDNKGPGHSEIQSAIEQAKMKLPIVTAHHTKKKKSQDLKKNKHPTLKYDIKAGRQYGYKPKFVRMRILHMYMFYLIYGYEGDCNQDQSCKEAIIETAKADPSISEEMSFVYRPMLDWRMFLPPLPIHSEYPSGWCLLSDVLLRLPLCLFVGIVNVPYNLPGLKEYLEHPIKRYFLVKEMPSEILYHLTIMRKYIFVISEIVSRLGFIGLIQMGPQKLKEKDQVFIYLNKHALLQNTIPSDAGYNHVSSNNTYETIHYEFNSFEDVEHYWYDLWNFAMNTNLGLRNSMTGKPVVVESVNAKKELLLAIQPRSVEEAKSFDVGYIPGDNLGAAGLDSDLFVLQKDVVDVFRRADSPDEGILVFKIWATSIEYASAAGPIICHWLLNMCSTVPPCTYSQAHLKRNWSWTGEKLEDATNDKSILTPSPVRKHHTRLQNSKLTGAGTSRSFSSSSQTAKLVKFREKEQAKLNLEIPKSKLSKAGIWKSRAIPKKKTRVLMKRKSKFVRKPYYDQKDKDALSKMVKLRVDWAPAEDNLLLICKVASLYMSPEKRRQVAKNFCAVREVLHSTYPNISLNKTSRACQRRMHYMMKNPSTAQSVYLCLEEIKQDPEITEKFHHAVEKFDALLKAQGEGPKGYQQEYDKIFMNLVATLMKKLKTVTNNENTLVKINLPPSIEEFEKKYTTVIPKQLLMRYGTFNEVQKTIDILASVINTVIHSSLCCVHDKTSYSHQLFYIYQQYPDKLLRYVMAKCRGMSIVSCRKRYKRWKSAANDCLPLASSPYQLSITYVHILQTKYQYHIFSECYNGLKILLNTPVKESDGISPTNVSANVEISSGGECANIVELFTADLIEMHVEFPDQLIVLDPRLSEREESYKLIMKRFKEMLSIINDARKKDKKTILNEDEEDDDDFIIDKNSDEDRDPYCEQINLKNRTGVVNTASRLALYLMRDDPLEQLDNSLQHAHDFFVLNPCKVTIGFDKCQVENKIFFKETKQNIISDIKRMAIFPCENRENFEVVNDNYDIHISTKLTLLDYIESKGDLGSTYEDLVEQFGYPENLNNCLSSLINEQFILQSGSVNVRFIHNKFAKPWLIKTFHLLRLVRDGMDTPSTNSAYAISFASPENSDKRKTKNTKSPCESSKKKIKSSNTGFNEEEFKPLSGRDCVTDGKITTSQDPDKEIKYPPSKSEDQEQEVTSPLSKRPKLNTEALHLLPNQDVEKETIICPSTNDDEGVTESDPVTIDETVDGPPCKRLKLGEIKEANCAPSTCHQRPHSLPLILNNDNVNVSDSTNGSNHNTPIINNVEEGNDEEKLNHSQKKNLENEQSSRFVMRTTKRRWVTIPNEHMKKFGSPDSEDKETILVKVRPWIKVDGTLNRRVLDRLLGSVLGHCLTCPGIPVKNLQKRFVPALQPVHTYELLQILVKIECVKLIEIKKSFKCSLFSKRVNISTGSSDCVGNTNDILVEPDPLAVSRLGYFIGDKNYNIEYLSALSDEKFI